MATLIPSLEKIKRFKVQPEEGELYLLNFLNNALDDSFEVYFNPYMNGDRPDIIIMKKGQGVLIIEVKDYNLDSYELDERKNWKVKNRTHDYTIKSPIQQVLKYKDNLFDLHIDNLLELKIKDIRNFNIVSCAVYFHNAMKNDVLDFLVTPFKHQRKYMKFLKYNIDLLGRDSLNKIDFEEILKNRYLISKFPSRYFKEEIYNSFHRFLKPPIHLKEEGKAFNYSPQQLKIIHDDSNIKSKLIKGVVGSGKTSVLAARAVQAHKKTGGMILILTYNITLKNFIHDKISLVREKFPWSSFVILNYHAFITSELNNLGIPVKVPHDFEDWDQEKKNNYFEENYYSNKDLFEKVKESIKPYDVVLIDEIQDYKRKWMEIIKDYFLVPEGEYVLFGDVKQNIYSNKIENKDIVTNIGKRGSTRFLKRCYRSDFKVKDLAIEYQKQIFKDKYELDNFNVPKDAELQFERNQQGHLNYMYLQKANDITSLYNIIHENAINKGIPTNDITVLSQTVKLLRDFDAYYRYKSNEKTNTMFETNEAVFRLGLSYIKQNTPPKWLQEGIKLIGRGKDWNKTKAFNELSILFTLYDLKEIYVDDFTNKFETKCIRFKTTGELFTNFVKSIKEDYNSFKKDFSPKMLSTDIKRIRDNKKIHFWFNSGTLKLSTVHSFKGWESELLFLIIEPTFRNSDFEKSFDEIIYTGLTRSRSNLIILNYGNSTYHDKLKRITDKIK